MNQISLDMYQTLGMAVAVLFLGAFLKKRIKFLETFCIPSPVVGGLIFAIVSCILYATGILEISFDETLKNVCMVIFFTSVGFQANLKVLKKRRTKPCGIFSLRNSAYYKPKPCFGRIGKVGRGKSAYRT